MSNLWSLSSLKDLFVDMWILSIMLAIQNVKLLIQLVKISLISFICNWRYVKTSISSMTSFHPPPSIGIYRLHRLYSTKKMIMIMEMIYTGFPPHLLQVACGLGTPTRDDDSDDSPLGRTGCLQVTTTEEFVIMLVETFNGALGTKKSPWWWWWRWWSW